MGTCGSCRFAEAAVMSDSPVLECRRFPPQLFYVNADDAATQSFPHMKGDDWCGEFQPSPGPG